VRDFPDNRLTRAKSETAVWAIPQKLDKGVNLREFKIQRTATRADFRLKVLLIVILLAICNSLMSTEFPFRYSLRGVPRVENGRIDLLKIPRGISKNRSQAVIFQQMKTRTEISVDYEAKTVKLLLSWGSIKGIYPQVAMDMDSYFQHNFRQVFRDKLFENSKLLLLEKERSSGQGLIGKFTFKLPAAAQKSKFVRNIFGKQAGSLSLDGSEKITIGGSSSKSNRTADESGNNRDFDLTMIQELNLRLKGKIGEKINVNVTHQSSTDDNFTSNPDIVEINYEGTEDEVVKSIEGGNIALQLTGSQYINYSASSQGLFGVKSLMEIGDLRLTMILGKDEAKKDEQTWKGDSKSDSTSTDSRNFEKRKFFFITDPQSLYLLYGDPAGDAQFGTNYPQSYADNAIRTDAGNWIMAAGSRDLLPLPGTLHVYFDDNTSINESMKIEGINLYDQSDNSSYKFVELIEGSEYTMDYDTGLLYINRAIDRQHRIAVTYQQRDGTQIGFDTAEYSPIQVKVIKKTNQTKSGDPHYWKLEARNIYKFGENYQSEGFDLYIFDDLAADGTQTITCPAEISAPLPSGSSYNEYLRLDTNGDGIVNGEDKTVSLASGYLTFAFLEPFRPLGDNLIYEEENVSFDDINMYISVKGKSSRSQISLDVFNVLPGSVKIKLGEGATERELKENVDYLVDYEFGIITFLNPEAKDSDAVIKINYNYKPTFSIDSKTLAGFRADWSYSNNFRLGATFVYQDERVRDDHPKIGNENKTLILSAIDGRMEYELPYLTKALDWLPLIATDEDSKITINGEVAMSIPRLYGNPDNPDEAYIDDMETILETFPLGATRAAWSPASKPYQTNLAKAGPNWYNPQNIYRKDIYNPESLTSDEQREEVQVLAVRLNPPNLHNPGVNNRYWGGVMKYLGNQLDFSTKRYIEVLVKVDSLHQNQKPVVMHVNIGDINEDFYTDFGGEGVLNTEDGKNGGVPDGQLDVYGNVNEDIGLDGIPDGEPGDDPRDNYSAEKDENGDYPNINGTENNGKLDTEDLDNNGELNDADVYFEYSLTLKDTTYLESDYNGWFLYRIPIDDDNNFRIVTNKNIQPDLKRISFARIWFEVEQTARIKLVNVDMIGNKWGSNRIRDNQENIISDFDLDNNRESMQVGIADNQKNLHYVPAPGTVIKVSGEETLEQSLTIDYTNLMPGHNGLVRQTFRDPFDFLNYNRIRFWVYSEKFENSFTEMTHDLVIRIGADSVNYYEINYPLSANDYTATMDKGGWIDFDIEFSKLTFLKSPDLEDTTYVKIDNYYSYYETDGMLVKMKRSPTLGNIKQISMGLENKGSLPYSGRIYFNDIRVAEPYNDIGYAARGNVNLKLADFATVDISTEWKTDNFQASAVRQTKSQNTAETTSLNINGNVNLHKLFPAQWGFRIPLALSRQENHRISRFMANSDILWEYLNDEDKKREQSHYLKYRADLTLELNKSPNTSSRLWNGFVDNTFKATDLSGYIEKKYDVKPTTIDTTLAYQVKHTYKFNIPKDKIGISILKNYKLYFFPNSFNNTLTYKADLPDGRRWRWNTSNDSARWELQSNTINTKSLATSSTVKYDILSDLNADYTLKTTRDLLLKNYLSDYNIGTEKNRDQAINISYNPKYLTNIFTYTTSLKIRYTDKTQKKSYNSEEDDFYYQGGVDRDASARITLKNRDLMMSLVNAIWKDVPLSSKPSSEKPRQEPPKEPNKNPEKQQEIFDSHIPEKTEFDRIEEKELYEMEQLKMREEASKPMKEITEPRETKNDEPEQDSAAQTPKPKINLIKAVVKYIGGLENVSINLDNNYSTDYDDLEERPPFEYQLGFPKILLEKDTQDSLGNTISKEITMRQDGNKISVSTGFPILKNLSSSFSYDWQIVQKYTSSSTQTITQNFPNVRLTLSDFQNLIGISSILKSSSITSSYALSNKQSGVVDWVTPNTEEISMNFSPLLSWQGNWEKNITSRFNLNHSESESIQYQEQGNTYRNSTNQSASADLSWSFTAEKGIKIPFRKTRFFIKNEATLSLNVTYSRNWGTKTGFDNVTQKEEDQMNFSFRPQVSYKFSKNITAGLTSEYKINNNNKTNNELTTFSLSTWVEIIF
jgi:hypothetical protein